MHCCTLQSKHDLQSIAAALPQHYPYLLDSAAPGPLGQHSLLLRSSGEQLCKYSNGSLTGPGLGDGFLSRLDEWYVHEAQSADNKTDWPFTGGWFVYLGYELAAEVEPKVNFPPANDGFPVAFATRCPAAILTRTDQPGILQLIAETPAWLEQVRQELESLVEITLPAHLPCPELWSEPAEVFKQAVAKIHEYILDGDVFQVNLSRGWQGEFSQAIDPAIVYRSLRINNPAPFAGLVRWREYALLSSSPERLVHLRLGDVQSRPIAGTHPRGADIELDNALSRELLSHPKERAEHIMLIDLERNDLGRVCQTGSVEVDELMVVESYEHVHHIVSNVRGRLRPGVRPVDVMRAVFPGGTITGCPKVRCMEIIAELEKHGRSFYTGSFGYLGLDGSMDLNILIRSMLMHNKRISFRTGAGIVADSDPDREVAETQDKARGLLRALGACHE